MNKNLPIFPFLIALYPILTLYARNPGEIPFQTVVRPVIAALLITGVLIVGLNRLYKNLYKASLVVALLVFYFSSSGHVYKILKGYLFPDVTQNLHPALIILELLLIILIANKRLWDKYLAKFNHESVTGYANLFSLLILIYPTLILINFGISTTYENRPAWIQTIAGNTEQSKHMDAIKPDIYIIILDGYARNDVLSGLYGFDNSYFTDALKQRRFYIAEKSHSNYMQTPLSFASFLNYSHINTATQFMGVKSINRLPLFELIEKSNVITSLRELDYELVTTESGFHFTELETADDYLSPFSTRLSAFEKFFLSTTSLDAISETKHPAFYILQKWIPVPSYATHRENVRYSLVALKGIIPNIQGPKLVIVHVVSPHPPFVINKSGENVTPNRPYMPGDGEAFGGSSAEYQRQYVEQLEFLNKEILMSIDEILANSAIPPIIILQGDHGPGSFLRRDDIEGTCIWERSSILNAYYLPDISQDALYPEITPVNTFRVIFNSYFGTNYELLPDNVYFSPQAYPYDFTNVTGYANDPCSNAP